MTAAAWKVVRDPLAFKGAPVVLAGSAIVVVCHTREAQEHVELIAAAPELLDALEGIRGYLDKGPDTSTEAGALAYATACAAVENAVERARRDPVKCNE
jgi:hypothetical protein